MWARRLAALAPWSREIRHLGPTEDRGGVRPPEGVPRKRAARERLGGELAPTAPEMHAPRLSAVHRARRPTPLRGPHPPGTTPRRQRPDDDVGNGRCSELSSDPFRRRAAPVGCLRRTTPVPRAPPPRGGPSPPGPGSRAR